MHVGVGALPACHALSSYPLPALRSSAPCSIMGAFIYAFSLLTFIYAMMTRMTLIRQPYRQSPASWQLADSVLQGLCTPAPTAPYRDFVLVMSQPF